MKTITIFLCSLSLLVLIYPEPGFGQIIPDAGADNSVQGIVDLHSHLEPGSRGPRSLSAIEGAEIAKRRGMRAMVLKNHYGDTSRDAFLVSQVVPGIDVYGGIALNLTIGGLNLHALENMVSMTGALGRIVWLPTFDSVNNAPDGPNVPISRNGEPLPELLEIFDFMAANNLALATGHVSPEEVLMAVRAARAAGIERIVVTHPSSSMTAAQQLQAAEMGALLEYTILSRLGGMNRENSQQALVQFFEQIRAVGAENVVITSDLGQMGNPSPADGFRLILGELEAAGFSQREIDLMVRVNPARYLGLD